MYTRVNRTAAFWRIIGEILSPPNGRPVLAGRFLSRTALLVDGARGSALQCGRCPFKRENRREEVASENQKYEIIEGLDISEVRDGDEVLSVRFECGKCHRPYEQVLPEVAGAVLAAISLNRCQNLDCREFTGFQLSGTSADTSDRRKELSALLAENPKHPAEKTRSRIHCLTKDRNLKLRFKVRRLPKE